MTDLRSRIETLIETLSQGLIERTQAIRLGLLAALAGEHLLLIGPPGTAKSQLARRLHLAFSDARYFERLLTRFSVPEELFGPLSIAALEEDRYERQTAGYLPAASIAFIDEVFKANSAILNALLTLLNEREFDNGTERMQCPLISVIGASNEVPDDDIVAAFYDRFLLRLPIAPVSQAAFASLLAQPDVSIGELPDTLKLSRADLAELAQGVDAVSVPDTVLLLLAELRDFLAGAEIYVSDRRWRKIVRLLKTAALTNGRSAVSLWDCYLTQFCATRRPEQCVLVGEWYARQLGVFEALQPQHFTRVVEGFEQQLQLEENAKALNYQADGTLAMSSDWKDPKHGEAAPRLPVFSKRQRYCERHIAARLRQVGELGAQVAQYLAKLDAMVAELHVAVAQHLWIEPGFAALADARLGETRANVAALGSRLAALAAGFSHLPRLLPEDPPEDEVEPAPMVAA